MEGPIWLFVCLVVFNATIFQLYRGGQFYWWSQGTQVSSTNKTDCHDIAEILLKVVLSTINHNHFDVIVVTKMLFWHVFLIFFFSFYDTTIVFVAAGVTCLVCLSISLFAIQTKVKQKLRPSRWCYSYSHPLDKVVR